MNIAVASGKGGTGKTTMAVNLSVLLSKDNEFSKNVVLGDVDVEEPNSALFLDAGKSTDETIYRAVPEWDQDKCTLCMECKDYCYFNAITVLPDQILIDPSLCHSCYACTELCPENALPMGKRKTGVINDYEIPLKNSSFRFTEGTLDLEEQSPVFMIEETMKYIQNSFSDDSAWKVFDSPPGTTCSVVETLKMVDYVIFVSEPTPFGLHDLELAVSVAKNLNKPFGVIINRYTTAHNPVEEYCNDSDIEILAKFPADQSIAELYSTGSIIYGEHKGFSDEMENLSERLKEKFID